MYNKSIFLESGKKIRGDNQNVLSVIKIAFHQARLSPDYVDTQGTSFYLLVKHIKLKKDNVCLSI
jgi:hypothetical protein